MTGPMFLDRSSAMLLAVCAHCTPVWRTVAAGDADAWRRLAQHADTVHPGDKTVRHATRRGRKVSPPDQD